MRKIYLALGAALAMGAFISTASAAPMSPAGSTPAVEGSTINVHGFHPWCDWGPYGRHRHVPGAGRVPCRDGAGPSHCHRWRNECADRWGWGNYEFRRCLRRHGC